MTPTEFTEVLRAGAGGDAPAETGADFLDTTFEELGYDSLALLETLSRIERSHGVSLPDEVIGELTTPRSFLDLVNEHLRRALPV
ncbi:hypothetical protein BJP25_05795 [Actinokineospora bangkokensis]|uniref:Carrier domain-containing protein n=2 Tax=Actinokineospora bangkokensis TaxID=1193682 RepID=A0A1Q9LC68_9PSEU|nr:hypothetical protein BJP25_05795 [Actinokineospora bangkokensis]